MWIYYTIVAMIFYTVAEYYSKRYATDGTSWFMFLSIIFYMITVFLWFPTLSNKNELCVVSLIWTMLYAIIGSFLGLIVFKEVLTPIQMLGVGLAFVSIFLLTK
jgi:multidrug transporter EmrE-like cation transporter